MNRSEMNTATVFLLTQVYRGWMNCTQRTSAGSLLKRRLYAFDVPDARRYLVNTQSASSATAHTDVASMPLRLE